MHRVTGVGLRRRLGGIRSWVVLAIILAHALVIYGLAHAPARVTLDGPPMFRAAIANEPIIEQVHPVRSRSWQPPAAEVSTRRVREWHFPKVDIWPVTGEACPTASQFGPLMGTRPVADEAPAQATPDSKLPIPKSQEPRMVLWLRPAYPLEWARTEMEGTVMLSLRIGPTGDTSEIEIGRSSGSQRLDVLAAGAARSWRFTPEKWQGRPIGSKATVELTFRFFEFTVSRIDAEAITTASKIGVRRTIHGDRSQVVRKLMEQLRTRTTNVFVASGYADAGPSWPASMHDWGPVSDIQYLGTIGRPQWRGYKVKSEYRASESSNSVVLRWELYRVVHDNHAALWEAGLDRTGGVWALKAESLEALEQANKPAVVCQADDLTTTTVEPLQLPRTTNR
jgi:TonB family protein